MLAAPVVTRPGCPAVASPTVHRAVRGNSRATVPLAVALCLLVALPARAECRADDVACELAEYAIALERDVKREAAARVEAEKAAAAAVERAIACETAPAPVAPSVVPYVALAGVAGALVGLVAGVVVRR